MQFSVENIFRNPTVTIVNSISNNIITCANTPINISTNDIIFNHNGYLIGKVTAINTSSKQITIGGGIIFEPSQYDELIKKSRKIYVDTSSFNDIDAFSAINYLATKKGIDYNISDSQFIAKDIDEDYEVIKYHLSTKQSRMLGVDSNKSMFDKANKIIVVGDGVKAEAFIPTNGKTRTYRAIEPNIKTLNDAQVKAERLLQLYNEDIVKAKIRIQKEGIELLRAGDRINLDFEGHGLVGEYTVFEIENVLSGIITMTIGTFNKTIAERLSEETINNKNAKINIFTKNTTSLNL